MERESFESKEIGEILNKHFVSIKVDREERPDIDKIYMTFVQVNDFLIGMGICEALLCQVLIYHVIKNKK